MYSKPLITAVAAFLLAGTSNATALATPSPTPSPPESTARSAPKVQPSKPRIHAEKDQRYDVAQSGQIGVSVPVEALAHLTGVTTIQVQHADPRAPSIQPTNRSGRVFLEVGSAVRPGKYMIRFGGKGCVEDECGIAFTVKLTVTAVVPQDAGPEVADFQPASQDRIAAAEVLVGDTIALRDELLVTLGTPDVPGDMDAARQAASLVGATVTGGIAEIGVYQFRWTVRPDLSAVMGQLEAMPGVTAASRATFATGVTSAEPPGDWSDDKADDAATWPFTQVRAQQAWDITTGSSTRVGILDVGTVLKTHEDLDVVKTLGSVGVGGHATHVAGLACAKANGIGLVGAAWGCPITTSGVEVTGVQVSDADILKGAWAIAKSGVAVVNMSLGWWGNGKTDRCVVSVKDAQSVVDAHKGQDLAWRQLMNGVGGGREVVWTIAAGNDCAPMTLSPWSRNYGLPNVITVAATNYDGQLASFSNYGSGVEVAAPGGVGPGPRQGGVWSTYATTCTDGTSWCGTYKQEPGTSMAAPIVAGIAALARSADTQRTAADIGSCIVSTAGRRTGSVTTRSADPTMAGKELTVTPPAAYPGGLKIVDAEAAVKCAKGQQLGGSTLIWGAGDRTASGDGSDIGDLTARLTETGSDVSTSQTLPQDLSGFSTIWYIDTDRMSAADQQRIEAFVKGGGSLFLTGEWGCCAVDTSTVALINALTAGGNGSVRHAGSVSIGSASIRADAVGGLATTPNKLSQLKVSAAGSLSGVPRANVVANDGASDARAVIAAWDSADVVGGGRIVVVMDINWFPWQYRGDSWDEFAVNVEHFLEK